MVLSSKGAYHVYRLTATVPFSSSSPPPPPPPPHRRSPLDTRGTRRGEPRNQLPSDAHHHYSSEELVLTSICSGRLQFGPIGKREARDQAVLLLLLLLLLLLRLMRVWISLQCHLDSRSPFTAVCLYSEPKQFVCVDNLSFMIYKSRILCSSLCRCFPGHLQ